MCAVRGNLYNRLFTTAIPNFLVRLAISPVAALRLWELNELSLSITRSNPSLFAPRQAALRKQNDSCVSEENMITRSKNICHVAAGLAALVLFSGVVSMAQSPQMEDKLMAIKQNMAANKQKLAQYSWTEVETISIKGDVKDTKTYQVRMANGQQQKTLVNDQKASSGGGRREGRLKEHVVEKKTEEFQQYGQQIGALAKQYTTPDPDRLMQAKQQGNLSLQPGNGTVSLVIKSFVKPHDQVTMTISEQTKAPVSIQVNSYLNDPSDAVNINAQFAQLPDGTNHVATTTINGVAKQLTVSDQNSNYQKM